MRGEPDNFVGIDYSMTCPCLCVYHGPAEEFSLKSCHFHYLVSAKKYEGTFYKRFHGTPYFAYSTQEERFDLIARWASDRVVGDDRIALEGYSYGSKGATFDLGELTGALKYRLWKQGNTWDTVAPTELKKWATGKGNAKKEQMHAQFLLETKFDAHKKLTPEKKPGGSPVSDIVDSYFLCKWAAQKKQASE